MWSVITIILSLVLLIVLALRGFSIIIIAPVVSLFVIATNSMPVLDSFQNDYMTGFINYAKNYYLIFLFAAMFGKFMEDSGAARKIAETLLRLLGKGSKYKVLVSVMAICAFLTYGGISLFVVIFAVLPIAKPLFKELDIPWHLFLASFFIGIGTFTMTMLPGTPAIQNIIPISYLGTSVTSGALIGITATVTVLAFNLWYLRYALRKAEKKGETYGNMKNLEDKKEGEVVDQYADKKLPSLWISAIPPVLLLIMLNVLKIEVLYTLMISVVISSVVFWKYIDVKKKTVNVGATNAVLPLVNTSADVGYGAVIAATTGFAVFTDLMTSLPGSPLISLYVATTALAGITGSASGGLGIAMETLSDIYLNLDLNPDAIHRVAAMASGGLDALPHNGAVITTLVVAGLTHKDGYIHVFMTAVVGPLVAAVPAILVAATFY